MEHTKGEIRISETPYTYNLVMGKARIIGKIGKSEHAECIAALWNAGKDLTNEQAVAYLEHGAEMVRALQGASEILKIAGQDPSAKVIDGLLLKLGEEVT